MEKKKSNNKDIDLNDLSKVSGGKWYYNEEEDRFIDEDGYYDSEGNYHTRSDPERIH